MPMIEIKIPLKAMGAVRMTQRGKWASKTAMRYLDYKEMIKMYAKQQYRGPILTGPLHISCDFYFKAPKSYSKKKMVLVRANKLHYVKRPDVDNLFKGITDSLNKIIYTDDSYIVSAFMTKQYADEDYVDICIKEIKDENSL